MPGRRDAITIPGGCIAPRPQVNQITRDRKLTVVNKPRDIARRSRSYAWWATIVAEAAGVLLSASSHALSPDVRLTQLYHTGWTAREGAPTGILSIAQTHDGYLWMGNAAGLFRFDRGPLRTHRGDA